MPSLRARWGSFWEIFFDPWAFICLLATVIFAVLLVNQTDAKIIGILTLVISLSSSVVGGIYAKRWDDITSEKVVVARGKQAIRSLTLLLGQVTSLEDRIRIYLSRTNNDEVVELYFEETIEKCINMQEDVIKAIEDWKEVLPEAASIKTSIGEITKLKRKLQEKEAEITSISLALQDPRGKSREEIDQLQGEQKGLQTEIVKLADHIHEEAAKVGTTVPSSVDKLLENITRMVLKMDEDGKWQIVQEEHVDRQK